MPIPLEALQDDVIYCVHSDATHHENTLLRGADVLDFVRANPRCMLPQDSVPERYTLVKLPDASCIAIWQDPSGPELIDDSAGVPSALSSLTEIKLKLETQPGVASDFVLDSSAIMPDPDPLYAIAPPEVDQIAELLQTAANATAEAFQTPVKPKRARKPREQQPALPPACASSSQAQPEHQPVPAPPPVVVPAADQEETPEF